MEQGNTGDGIRFSPCRRHQGDRPNTRSPIHYGESRSRKKSRRLGGQCSKYQLLSSDETPTARGTAIYLGADCLGHSGCRFIAAVVAFRSFASQTSFWVRQMMSHLWTAVLV